MGFGNQERQNIDFVFIFGLNNLKYDWLTYGIF